MRCLDGITDSMDMNLSKLKQWKTEEPGVLQSMGLQRVRCDLVTERQQQHAVKETEDSHTSVLALVEEENFGYQLNNQEKNHHKYIQSF